MEGPETGIRLACKAVICEDVNILVSVESEMDASVLRLSAGARRTARIMEPSFPEMPEGSLFSHPVGKKYMELIEPAAGDNVPDTTRLISALQQDHGERRLSLDMDVVRRLPDLLRQADYRVTATLSRSIPGISGVLPMCRQVGFTRPFARGTSG